jgi:hypothetical protein
MKPVVRIGQLVFAISLGTIAFVLVAAGFSAAAESGEVDLKVEINAPAHVAAGAVYEANVAYANIGSETAADSWLIASLPEGTTFVAATDTLGMPLPPDATDGNELSWTLGELAADSCRGHVLIRMLTDQTLEEGTLLTTTATISTTDVESNTLNNTASATSTVCDMAGSTKQVQAQHAIPGGVLSYTIRISLAHKFAGGENGRWVTLTDTLPFSHQVRFLGWSGTVTGAEIDGHTLSWQGRVRAGHPLTLQYRLGVERFITPNTILTNVAWLNWDHGNIQLGPVTTVVTIPQDALVLGPFEGGTLIHPHGVRLDVPPGAVTDTTLFRLGPIFTDTHPISPPGGLLFAHRAFEMTASRYGNMVHAFSRPLTITLHYTDKNVQGLKRETLQLWTRTGPSGPWAQLGDPAKKMSGTLSMPSLVFTTTHFSQFALFGEGKYQCYLPLMQR